MSKAKIVVKPVPVTLDRKRNLLFDMNALCEAEDALGDVPVFEALSSGKIKHLRTLLWAGLVHEDETLTEKQVGTMIGFGELDEIANLLTKAVSRSYPEAKN